MYFERKYTDDVLSVRKCFDTAPTFFEIDISLSFNIRISGVFVCPASFIASYIIPPVSAPSPKTDITL